VSWGNYITGDMARDRELMDKMEQLALDIPFVRAEPGSIPIQFPVAEFQSVPPRGNLLWAAVDLDGTLAEGVWTADNPTSEIGPVKVYADGKTARDKCIELVEAGYKIVIHTARGYTDLENIERWLEFHQIPYRQVVCGKLLAAVYIDDRNRDIEEESWVPERKS
jgi:hypothetical protein